MEGVLFCFIIVLELQVEVELEEQLFITKRELSAFRSLSVPFVRREVRRSFSFSHSALSFGIGPSAVFTMK